jgi:hypothetical protein
MLVVIALIYCSFSSVFAYSGDGDGSADKPYQITTIDDWTELMSCQDEDWSKYFILTADLPLNWAYPLTPIGNPTTNFTGDFDGQGHIIFRAYIEITAGEDIGLFGYIGSGGHIKDLGVDVNVYGNNYIGILAGENHGLIENCYTTGEAWGNTYSGGLVGKNFGTITSCHSLATVRPGAGYDLEEHLYAGGLTGWNQGTITDCYAICIVRGKVCIGGLVGENLGGSITDCYTTGMAIGDFNVGGLIGCNDSGGSVSRCWATGTASGTYTVGGLVGQNGYTNGTTSSISDCYATGDVNVYQYIGGLVGRNGYNDNGGSGNITNCYSTGKVHGDFDYGGLVGDNSLGSVIGSFWDTDTSGRDESDGGTPKTTVEMKTKSTFTDAGWDFTNTWAICPGTNYPRLIWQIPKPDFRCPDGVDFYDFAFFAAHWMESDCSYVLNLWCEGTDLNQNGTVNFEDVAMFVQDWLETYKP